MKRIIGLVLVLALLSCSAMAENKSPMALLQEYEELIVGEWISCDYLESIIIDRNELYISANGSVYYRPLYEYSSSGYYEILFSNDTDTIMLTNASGNDYKTLIRPNDTIKSYLDDPISFITSGKWIDTRSNNEYEGSIVFNNEKMIRTDGDKIEENTWELDVTYRIDIGDNYYDYCNVVIVNGILHLDWEGFGRVFYAFEKE